VVWRVNLQQIGNFEISISLTPYNREWDKNDKNRKRGILGDGKIAKESCVKNQRYDKKLCTNEPRMLNAESAANCRLI